MVTLKVVIPTLEFSLLIGFSHLQNTFFRVFWFFLGGVPVRCACTATDTRMFLPNDFCISEHEKSPVVHFECKLLYPNPI